MSCTWRFLFTARRRQIGCAAAVNYHPIKSKSGSLLAASGARASFDYLTVDADARRAYAAHGMEVDVLNADDHAMAGQDWRFAAVPRSCRPQGPIALITHDI